MTITTESPIITEDLEKRTIMAEWPLYTKQTDEGTEERRVVLRVSHYASRKAYTASLDRESVIASDRGYTIRKVTFRLSGTDPIPRIDWPNQPTARFNRKQLREYFDRILATVELNRDEEESIRTMFDAGVEA